MNKFDVIMIETLKAQLSFYQDLIGDETFSEAMGGTQWLDDRIASVQKRIRERLGA